MSIMTMPKIDIYKLKEEIKELSKLNRHYKKTAMSARRKLGDKLFDLKWDPKKGWVHKDPARAKAYEIWCESNREWDKLSYRITHLCALRAYLRGKDHFGPNSRFLDGVDLEKWLYRAAQEFAVSGI